MPKPEKCLGCNSYRDRCKEYLMGYETKRKIFRSRFCPCTTCLLKPTCQDPKISFTRFKYPSYKCKMFYEAVCEYKNYVNNKNSMTIKLKRKKKIRR